MLGMLQILETMLPEDVPYAHIFDDYKETIESMHESGEQLSKFHQLLIKIRLLKFLGILNTTNINNPIISYISREITTTEIGKILKAR
jgi:recombinational DNA repair protein (RecF pathway)